MGLRTRKRCGHLLSKRGERIEGLQMHLQILQQQIFTCKGNEYMQTHNKNAAQTYQHNLYPDARGRFGAFGGKFVPESLMVALAELETAYAQACNDAEFQSELQAQLLTFFSPPTTLHYAPRFSQLVATDVKVYLKREDLAHTGAHKINNALGQGLLSKRMGKRRIIAETGAGPHGVP